MGKNRKKKVAVTVSATVESVREAVQQQQHTVKTSAADTVESVAAMPVVVADTVVTKPIEVIANAEALMVPKQRKRKRKRRNKAIAAVADNVHDHAAALLSSPSSDVRAAIATASTSTTNGSAINIDIADSRVTIDDAPTKRRKHDKQTNAQSETTTLRSSKLVVSTTTTATTIEQLAEHTEPIDDQPQHEDDIHSIASDTSVDNNTTEATTTTTPVTLLLDPAAHAYGTPASALPTSSDLSIGAAMYDITGPAAEVGMFGYAKAGQLTSGIHMRLRARAFAFSHALTNARCVYVVADVGMISEWVRQAVVARLATHPQVPTGAYTLANVMLSATHTHCSPGGTSHYFIYSMHPPLRGADRQNFECVVSGIVEAIARAHCNLQPAVVRVATGECLGASVNRSVDAYMANPESERAQYTHDTDKTMTLWRFDAVTGYPIGMINWFAVHPTSMGNWYTLITGDNKGYAAHMFEKERGTNHLMDRPRAFVAAFAQSNEGDVSPNICGPRHCTTQHKDFERMLLVANAQLATARVLYAQAAASPALSGGIEIAHQYVEFGKIALSPKWHQHRECPPSTSSGCIGVSMMGGTTFDGRGVQSIPEGVTWGAYPKLTTLPQLQGYQKEKPIFFPTARFGLSPAVLPLQLFVLADCLPIAAAPFEITTMAGRRLRAAIAAVFQDLGREAMCEPVLSGLSNAYCGYLTTREEYAVQRYEGASTHFGPNQLCATAQQFEVLARAVCAAATSSGLSGRLDSSDGSATVQVETLPPPRVNGVGVWDCNLPVLHDGLLHSTAYGHIVPGTDVLREYRPGSTAAASFHAAHPKNDLRTQGTFLEVHRWVPDARRSDGGIWVMHADDGDANTLFHWKRVGTFASVVTLEWWIPPTTPAGRYRLKVNGDVKRFFARSLARYSGVSSAFEVVNATSPCVASESDSTKCAIVDSSKCATADSSDELKDVDVDSPTSIS